ncbi:prepilin peptidase [Vulgatibacter incomptus]|uniref:Prepilin leader peptidase/N-methyltransferase n=1 Tax=Vulgatibacter incomptus TaxID=1391653 RepID=A0A0K1PB14_9BACT|nr:A24 family peptidase [Vulgatibacter incomptus]AKU90314.1 Leader peptidase (Prepilin peptidase) [Vulgatibacter incomptus]
MSDLPTWYFVGLAAVFGALVGSFLNVVIARLPKGLSIVHPRSRCPRCERPIAWHENIPVVSWLLLRGRCRGCKLPISIRYPLVELATSLLAVACVRNFGPTPWAVAAFVFLAALVALTYIDLDHWLLPRSMTVPFIAVGLGASLLPDGPGIASSALGAAVGFASFAALGFAAERILKKEALGGGDLWLFAMIGAFLGVKALLPVALFASAQGAAIGVVLLSRAKRKAARSAIPADAAEAVTALPPPKPTGDEELDAWVPPDGAVPFGPFLALGAAEYLFFGEKLVAWYLSVISFQG